MATDYFLLLKRATEAIERDDTEARHSIYDRARRMVETTLRNRTPALPEAEIKAEQSALEDAIWRVELDMAAPAPRAPPTAVPTVEHDRAPQPPPERMRYVRSILQPGERVLARGRYHWIVYMEALLSLLIGAFLFALAPKNPTPSDAVGPFVLLSSIVLIVMSPVLVLRAWFNQWITEIAVTNLRVIHKSGFIRRRTWEMNMGKIESVTVDQSVLGRILGYGTVHVMGTGTGTEHLHRIAQPIDLRNWIVAR